MVAWVWLLPVLVDEKVSVEGAVRACLLGSRFHGSGQFWGVHGAGLADGSEADGSAATGVNLVLGLGFTVNCLFERVL